MEIFEKLPGVLLPWYEVNKRSLPWRQVKEPYHIWVSEIMLQQTRVEAVKGYYARFLARMLPADPEKIRPLLDHDVADPWYTGNFSETWNDIVEGCTKILEEFA